MLMLFCVVGDLRLCRIVLFFVDVVCLVADDVLCCGSLRTTKTNRDTLEDSFGFVFV